MRSPAMSKRATCSPRKTPATCTGNRRCVALPRTTGHQTGKAGRRAHAVTLAPLPRRFPMGDPQLLPIASMTLLGAATAVRCRLFGHALAPAPSTGWRCNGGALQNLVMHLQRHRGLSSMWLNGDRSVGPRLHRRARASQPAHAHLAQLPDGHLSAADVLPRACRWRKRFCADWRALCAELEQLDAADSIARPPS